MSRQGVTTQHSAPSHSAKGNSFSLHHLFFGGCLSFRGGGRGGRGGGWRGTFSDTPDLKHARHTRTNAKYIYIYHSETRTPRLILLTRPLNVITRRNVKLKIHIPADPWSSHNWHTSIFFFCCGYRLMKLKANEIISQGEDIRESIFRRTYSDYHPPSTPHAPPDVIPETKKLHVYLAD